MSGKSAAKASSFMNAFGPFGGGEFRKGNGIDIHGIQVRGGLGVDKCEEKGSLPPFRARMSFVHGRSLPV